MNNHWITKGMILAGLMNISGVLVFSKFLINPVIQEFDNQAMSNFGLLMIMIWGLAYISVSKSFHQAKWLIGVFALEKLIYAVHWTSWIRNNNLNDVFEKDQMAGIYYAIYGLNDWLFFAFFLLVLVQLNRNRLTTDRNR